MSAATTPAVSEPRAAETSAVDLAASVDPDAIAREGSIAIGLEVHACLGGSETRRSLVLTSLSSDGFECVVLSAFSALVEGDNCVLVAVGSSVVASCRAGPVADDRSSSDGTSGTNVLAESVVETSGIRWLALGP